VNDYQDRKAERVDRLRERAAAKRKEADANWDKARAIGSAIPPGQPVLVGHHSQRRHERDIARIDGAMSKSAAAVKEAEELERRAVAAEHNTSISSDSPTAIAELEAKVADLERQRERMKLINRQYKKGGWEAVEGLSDDGKAKLESAMVSMRATKPFPAYALTNIGGRIRNTKERLEKLRKMAAVESSEETIGEVTISDNGEANRVQMFFPGKPDEQVRARLKRGGWRWSRAWGCWQRHRSPAALEQAREIATAATEEG
jgi:hypothetical protein